MFNVLHRLLGGSSPITGYLGSVIMVVSGVAMVLQALETNGIPTDLNGWLLFIAGLASRFAKDANKSNAINPTAVAQTISSVLVPVLLLGLVGCSAAQLQKTQAVLVKLKADGTKIAIVGCANLPVTEVVIATALDLLPPGTTIEAINAGVQIAEPQVEAFCAQLQRLAPPVAPVPASPGPTVPS